ncbi:MAG: hypothetical protein ABR577_15725 [Pyrinomonadaceae bacterium]
MASTCEVLTSEYDKNQVTENYIEVRRRDYSLFVVRHSLGF